METASRPPKKWGKENFWGLNSDYELDWMLTEEQVVLRDKLIEMCRTKIRPRAAHYDKTYEFPKESLNDLAELGLLTLVAPKTLGGLGQNHVGIVMVMETLARYGCPSTAMIYCMHLMGVIYLLLRHKNNRVAQNFIKRINTEKLIGGILGSDPATGSHFWSQPSSKYKVLDEKTVKILKYGSWATSSGCADWYMVSAVSPEAEDVLSTMSFFLVDKEHVRASTDDWKSLGLHANQSGPIIVEGKIPIDRLVGEFGDGLNMLNEIVCIFLMALSSVWNGISLGCVDIAKKHVTRRAHADVGMRICDYPTIQEYFGDCLSSSTVSRSHLIGMAQKLDDVTNNCDFSLNSDPEFQGRAKFVHWFWIARYFSANTVSHVTDAMLQACGGTGYKTEMGLERLLRDGKAAKVMAPTNELLCLHIGKTSLLGFSSLDLMEKKCDERILHHELGKLALSDKKSLIERLTEEVKQEESGEKVSHPFQDTDFENPFNISLPRYITQVYLCKNGKLHGPGLNQKEWTPLELVSKIEVCNKMFEFTFNLPNVNDHTGCLPGQYVQVRAKINGQVHERFLSPVSVPNQFGKISVVLKLETQGIISQYFNTLDIGKKVDFLGPCGGFEYEANKLDEITLIASGAGITPGIQIIRSIINNEEDKTKISLIYYADNYEEMLYRDELQGYASTNSKMRMLVTLGESPENWNGEEGYITTEMLDTNVTKPSLLKHKIVLCGSATMVISCLHSLRTLKFPPQMIFIYGQFGTAQIRVVYGQNSKLSGHTCET